jgi:tRNA(Ile)-lysidine synthase
MELKANLFDKNDKILLAVSGGVDSVVLLDMLAKDCDSPFSKLALAHCNFQLRGQESEEDEVFVRQLAENYGLLFFSKRFDTNEIVKKTKSSVQLVARQLRYDWFYELLKELDFQYIATAHHQNDSIETVIYNLSKGTGIAGLHGILPKQGRIIRPLLNYSREEILTYATDNQLVWREDSSNYTEKYSRNLIRHQVIPILKKINPNLEETFKDTTLRIIAVERIFNEQVNIFRNKLANPLSSEAKTHHLDIQTIKDESENLVKLYEILKEFGFNFIQTKLIINSLEGEAGKIFESPTHTLVKDRTALVMSEKEIHATDNLLTFRIFEKTVDFEFSKTKEKVHLDAEKVGSNIKVRRWQDGDSFQPLGMKGKAKNISDLLNDLKIPLNLKRQVYVLTASEVIAWVIGYQVDDRFKVTEKTKTIIEICKH